MSAPGAPVFGSVPHQDPVCISGETNAVVTDFFGTISKAAIMQLERPHLQGPFSLGILNPQSSPADINIVDGWASTCVCWFGISLEQHCNLFPANSLQHLRPGITHARSRVAIGNRFI